MGIRRPDGADWRKNQRSKSCDTIPFIRSIYKETTKFQKCDFGGTKRYCTQCISLDLVVHEKNLKNNKIKKCKTNEQQ